MTLFQHHGYEATSIQVSQVDGIICIRPDCSRQMRNGDAEVQILAHGRDANRARIIQGYAQGAASSRRTKRVDGAHPRLDRHTHAA
jgi:ABC-2 type transport system permease protein